MTTPADVRLITGSELPDEVIQVFIDAADCIMERIEPCTTGKAITPDCIDKATTFLAAHLLTSSSVGTQSAVKTKERFEQYSVEWAVGTFSGAGTQGTPYGQSANAILGGCLIDVDKSPSGIGFFGGA